MSGFDWFLVGWWLLDAFIVVANVGKPKKPTEPLAAAFAVAIFWGFIAAMLISRGVL